MVNNYYLKKNNDKMPQASVDIQKKKIIWDVRKTTKISREISTTKNYLTKFFNSLDHFLLAGCDENPIIEKLSKKFSRDVKKVTHFVYNFFRF